MRKVVLPALSWAITAAGLMPLSAHADQVITLDEGSTAVSGSVNCGTLSGGCGTVTIHDNSNNTYTVTVDINPLSGLQLHASGGSGQNQTIAFDIAGSIGDSGPVTGLVSGAQDDGFGLMQFGAKCSSTTAGGLCTPTGVSPGNDLVFTVNAPSGELDTKDSQGSYLALDVAGTGFTGFVAGDISTLAAVPGPVVGAGLPGLIAACGGLLALARRRRRQIVQI